jgi:PAP2 superfamily protein
VAPGCPSTLRFASPKQVEVRCTEAPEGGRRRAAEPAGVSLTHQTQTARSRTSKRSNPWPAIKEIALVGGLFALYRAGRSITAGREAAARHHATLIHHVESVLRLPPEAAIQSAAGSEALFRVANIYYTTVHFPLMFAFLFWGYCRRPLHEYRWARNLAILQTSAALVIHVLFPLAPPRMFPNWNFVDSMTLYGPSPYGGVSADVANQFAAMPSLHVGWSVLIAYVLTRTASRVVAAAAWTHAALTTAVVVITANHWWLDAVVAVLLLVVADAALPRLSAQVSRT